MKIFIVKMAGQKIPIGVPANLVKGFNGQEATRGFQIALYQYDCPSLIGIYYWCFNIFWEIEYLKSFDWEVQKKLQDMI